MKQNNKHITSYGSTGMDDIPLQPQALLPFVVFPFFPLFNPFSKKGGVYVFDASVLFLCMDLNFLMEKLIRINFFLKRSFSR